MDLGDVGVCDTRFSAVERYASLDVLCFEAMNITAIDYQVMRNNAERSLFPIPKSHQVEDPNLRIRSRKLNPNKLVVMCSRLRLYDRGAVFRRLQFCKQR